MESLTLIITAYLLGAIPFAVLISRAFRLQDPRHYGSGNTGATNVARSGNRPAAALTLLADIGKGVVAVVAARMAEADAAAVAGVGVAAVSGHIFSVFLKFRGGRGVATALGVFAAWDAAVGGAAALVWLAVFGVSRYSSLASISAMVAAAVAFAVFAALPLAVAAAAVAVLVIYRHQDNIRRLIKNQESNFK